MKTISDFKIVKWNESIIEGFAHFQGFQVAYVVYRDAKSVKKAMKHEWADCVFSTEEAPIPTGINSKKLKQAFPKRVPYSLLTRVMFNGESEH